MINQTIESTGILNLQIDNAKEIINYQFGEYEVKVEVNSKNEFLGIISIGIPKRFYTHSQVKGTFDISQFYPEFDES